MKGFSKSRKMTFSYLEYLFSFWRYLCFHVKQMRKVMTSWVVPLKQYNTQSRISLELLKRCSSNLAPEMSIIKERKWRLSCRCHDNSYAAGAVLIETETRRFYLKQGSSTPNNVLARVKTIWEPCVSCFKRLQMGVFGFSEKETGTESLLPWRQNSHSHSVSFVMYIAGAKFEDHCFNISGDILDSVFYYLCGTM